MTNRFPGNCAACSTRVEAGQGIFTPATKTLVHSQCTPAAVATPTPRPFSIDRIYSLESFEQALSEQTDLMELRRIQSIIKKMNRDETKHPLNHTLHGYKRAFIALNKRAEQLGFKRRNSDGTFYKPLTVVAERTI
jgi:sugar diacid utilization regulator